MGRSRFTKAKELLLVFVVLLTGYLIHFWSYIPSFHEAIFYFSVPDDVHTISWNTWHFRERALAAQNPFKTELLAHPQGTSLLMHAYTPYFGILNLLLNNVALSINLGIFIQFMVMGLGYYRLSQHWVSRKEWALLAALFAVFNTYFLEKTGVHLNLILMASVPWMIILFFRSYSYEGLKLQLRSTKSLGALILLCLAQFLFDFYAIFFALSFIVIWFLFVGITMLSASMKPWVKWMAGLSLVGIGHVVVRLLRINGLDRKGAFWASADLRSLIRPSSNNSLLGQWYFEYLPHTQNDHKMFLGYGLMLAFVAALILLLVKKKKPNETAPHQSLNFIGFAVFIYLFVCFPVWHVGGEKILYSFTGFVHFIPFVNNVRAPDRFIAMLFWLIPLFTFMVLEQINFRKVVWLRLLLFALVGSLFMEHHMVAMKGEEKLAHSKFFSNLDVETALILPYGLRDGYQHFGEFDTYQLEIQQIAKLKIPSAYLSRLSDPIWEEARNNPFLQTLVKLQNGETDRSDYDLLAELQKLQLDCVIAPHDYLADHPQIIEALRRWNDGVLNGRESDGWYRMGIGGNKNYFLMH